MSDQQATNVKHKQPLQDGQLVWYCPSRWLLAHHDPIANIRTLSSHMCLADLNNDGDSLLALIDLKQDHQPTDSNQASVSPYKCRMRVYRGQQLIYNHFLDEMPSCLLATNINERSGSIIQRKQTSSSSGSNQDNLFQQHPMLTLAINDDVYFYNKLKASHRISLEDDEYVLDSLNKSEVDVWQMVKQNKVDTETLRELLHSLSQEIGNHELTSHSVNFLALNSNEHRQHYLASWKFKRLQNGLTEQIMSMDTICCAAARLKFNSNITRSGDFGQTRENGSFLNNSRWTRILDIQRDGLVLGTEDRHLLLYELRPLGTRLECHYRLPSVPDHILVERRSPSNFNVTSELKDLTYTILISCRNCRIYSIDQPYLVDKKTSPSTVKELVALKCNVLEMSWSCLEEGTRESQDNSSLGSSAPTWPLFIVACLNRQVYCFSSRTGQCKWMINVELPITCLVCLPKIQIGLDESSLVGVASQGNRIDFYVALDGRIVDSIYFSKNDYPEAIAYGRFGREDNCLCLVSHLGHLLIFILKRTAKFAHGQCLSSAASYASDTLASSSRLLQQIVTKRDTIIQTSDADQSLKLDKQVSVPSAFSLGKSTSSTVTDQIIESIIQLDHDCDQVTAKNVLDAYAGKSQLQIPAKGRDFVAQILEQSRQSIWAGKKFANDMVKLSEKMKCIMEQESDLHIPDPTGGNISRVVLSQVTGLGSIYRVSLSIRLNLEHYIKRFKQLFSNVDHNHSTNPPASEWQLTFLIDPNPEKTSGDFYQVKPYRVSKLIEIDIESPIGIKSIFESEINFKLYALTQAPILDMSKFDSIEIQLKVLASHLSYDKETLIRHPILITSVNVPTSQLNL